MAKVNVAAAIVNKMSNTFGHIFRLTSFGESHGAAIGGVIDACPAGLSVDMDFIQAQLDRRRPGSTSLGTHRQEADRLEILSGVFEGKTTGAPIAFMVANSNQHSQDYDALREVFRPSHADYTYYSKYGIRDHRGGGRSSARESIARVVAGAFAQLALRQMGIHIEAFTTRIGNIALEQPCSYDSDIAKTNVLHCPDSAKAAEMEALILQMKAAQDSVGGHVHCLVKGVPPGWGEPHAQKLQSMLAAAMLSIPACKGFEYGSGFDISLLGSQANDAFYMEDGHVRTRSNHSGGIQGGISNGEDIYFNIAFKPIASISREQESVNLQGEDCKILIKGRHDPCVLPRALPVVEAMTAITLLDAYLLSKTTDHE